MIPRLLQHFCAYFRLRKAQSCFSRGQNEKGIEILQKIQQDVPGYHFALFHLGRKLASLSKMDDALQCLQQAISHAPSNPVYHTFLGLVLYDDGKHEEAKVALLKSLALDSRNQLTHNLLALCALAAGKFGEFQGILKEKGVFESSEVQIRLALALESYRKDRLRPQTDSAIASGNEAT